MKKILISAILAFLPCLLAAASITDTLKTSSTRLDSVVVLASRSAERSAMAHSNISREALQGVSANENLPAALSFSPAVVYVAENGTGSGYAHLRIRGSEASRINVSLNGISMNDAESQEVFWVNVPSIGEMLQDVQIQRGAGQSDGGTAAFGGSVNMQTIYGRQKAYAYAKTAYGSYNSFSSTIAAGSGSDSFLPKGWSFDFIYNHNSTDGYIRNAQGNLHSVFARIARSTATSSLKLQYIYGEQHTGITWEGISREALETDRRSNPAGAWTDPAGGLHYYPNETDNYLQHHLQLLYTQDLGNRWTFSGTLHYTRGKGYYENYKSNKKFGEYGLEASFLNDSLYRRSDFVVRHLMDNHYIAANAVIHHGKNLHAGVSYSYYTGLHKGDMLWAMYFPTLEPNYSWYSNTGCKQDWTAFAKYEQDFGPVRLIGHLQLRGVDYLMSGIDKDFANLDNHFCDLYLNPRLGINYSPREGHELYFSAQLAHREPSRSDFKENIKGTKTNTLKSEKMFDFEWGYRFSAVDGLEFGFNLYDMEYQNQLVPTGKLSDSGYQIKENVPSSFRRGLEFQFAWQAFPRLSFDGNICLSTNKIKNFTLYLDTYDNPDNWNSLPQKTEFYKTTDLIYSPGCTSMLRLNFKAWKGMQSSLHGRYVGPQYFDNSSFAQRRLDAYWTLGFTASQDFAKGLVCLEFFADNILDRKYVSNAWAYRAVFADSSADYVEEGFFPAAGIHFMLQLRINLDRIITNNRE